MLKYLENWHFNIYEHGFYSHLNLAAFLTLLPHRDGCQTVKNTENGKECYIVDSNRLSSRCVFKVLLECLSLLNFSKPFHNFILLLNLRKTN